MVIDTMNVYKFVDLNLVFEILFENEGQQNKERVDFDVEILKLIHQLRTCIWGWRKCLCKALILFYYFLVKKRIAFKCSIIILKNSIHSAGWRTNIRMSSRYTITLIYNLWRMEIGTFIYFANNLVARPRPKQRQ